MRIKIKSSSLLTGGTLGIFTQGYREMLLAVAGQWLTVETEHLFSDQYNTNGLRVMQENVAEVDYEGDYRLRAIHTLMRSRHIRCHSYSKGKLTDLVVRNERKAAFHLLKGGLDKEEVDSLLFYIS